MKNTIKQTLLAAALVCSGAVYAQTDAAPLKGQIRITADTVGRLDNDVFVRMNVDVTGKAVLANQALVITPILWNEDGYMEMPQVVINGKKRDKAYRRSLAISKKFREKMAGKEPYIVIRADKKTMEEVEYAIWFPYQTWMNNSWMTLRQDIYGPAARNRQIEVEPLAVLAEPKVVTVVVRDTVWVKITPPAPKELKKEGAAYLDFPVGQSRVMPDFSNNAKELARVNASLDSIWNNDKFTVTAIYLTGYASPDGSTALNQKLSKSRADALRTYLIGKHGGTTGLYHTEGLGEDWMGLEKLVEGSAMPSKDKILDVIRSGLSEDAKKAALKKIDGGGAYKYMLANLFPKLRRVEYQILYTETYIPKEAKMK